MHEASAEPPGAPSSFAGTWYVMPTTFAADGSLDLASQRSLTEAVLGWGVDGLTVLGVMGEASALDTDERAAVIRTVVSAAAGVPVAVGISSSARHTSVALARQAAACGAAAVMVAAPPLLRAADSLPGFFADVASQGRLPMIKLEDPPTPAKLSAVVPQVPAASLFRGLGGVASYFELRRGAVSPPWRDR